MLKIHEAHFPQSISISITGSQGTRKDQIEEGEGGGEEVMLPQTVSPLTQSDRATQYGG